MTYRPPIRDLIFALTELAGADRLEETGAYPDFDAETMAAVLDAAGEFAAGVLAPLNRSGDADGARFENGRVFAAPGFADAYRAVRARRLERAVGRARSRRTGPAQGAGNRRVRNGAQRQYGLRPVPASDAGRDRGPERPRHGAAEIALSRKARQRRMDRHDESDRAAGRLGPGATAHAAPSPTANGKYRLFGQKIFITWGDHDAADNIVHLVLARLPDAPEGTRGISLFLAPKRLVNDDGSLGAANGLKPVGIEHKLGIHASPTCVMAFEGAEAELVGVENQGLAQMFTMMNAARLQVGVEGVGIAERAYQAALAYARERKQGRSAWSGENPAPIFDHPDIRRMLMLMKARIEAARAICLATAVATDLAKASPDAATRESAKLREELFTPIAKAWSTDMGVAVASEALQVHGGMGFIEETGAAQHYRDARILPIYEGTNGIQAIDLMGRKLALNNGQAVRELLDEMWRTIGELKSSDNAWLHAVGARLEAGAGAVQSATSWLIERRGHAQPDALAGAAPFLKLLGDVIGGWMLARGALIASARARDGDDGLYWRTKIGLARVYADHVLAQAPGLTAAVTAGAHDLRRTTAEALGG